MTVAIVIALFVVWYVGLFVAKEMYADAKHRHDEHVWAAYHRQEAARWHTQRLADIDRAAQAAAEEMARVAAPAGEEVIESTLRR